MIARITIFRGAIMRIDMKSLFYKQAVVSLAITLFLVLLPRITFSQTTANHTITVRVDPVTAMQIGIGTININITGANAVAGQDQMSVIDESNTIYWGTNNNLQKISIKTNLTPLFTVKALATTITLFSGAGVIPAAEATLSTIDKDFLLHVGRSSGSAKVRYTCIALASQGTGAEMHTITFTIQSE
jgi:hypothetical protein